MPDLSSLNRLGLRLALPRLRRMPARPGAPLFVIGSGRSGNTLVRRVLMASGQIYIPPETYVLGDIIEGWPRTALLPWRERVWLFCAQFEKHRHFVTFGLPDLNDFAAQAIEMEDRRLRPLISALFAYLARAAGSDAPRWGDKTPWNAFHLPAIAQTFPRAQFLWLIRDGRDVALSYAKAGLLPDFAAGARRWAKTNRACGQFARWSPNLRQLRYEALVQDPEREMRAVFDWAGLDFAPEMLNADVGAMGDVEHHAHHAAVAAPISPRSVGRWRSDLSPADLETAPAEFRRMLARLGYD
ncbi:sulfotransferase [Jannaschia sp. S6380]|uniref:sulfotransferase family protein n=1 Tax=Jannaschia sp. S6380 TaxID=2926408 RepID=UPI001FF4A14B|nr:sulfotransferase [Jannaschia sp. S6380]MCK0168487.1 sulfotransferase [Jannaschia sp. S6380]